MALTRLKGFGPKSVHSLGLLSKGISIESYQELTNFVNAAIEDKKNKIRAKSIDSFLMRNALQEAEEIIARSEEMGIRTISFLDKDYPSNLHHTIDEEGHPSVPAILFYKGDISICQMPAIAIIGTREPTPNGEKAGKYLGQLYAQEGFNIVSGLAIGCDTCGHQGALSTPNGITTAFLAHGLDKVYPKENGELAEEIVNRGGLLMSEYPIGTDVNRYNLVARDRLQAALADAIVVIQTGEKGGTLHASNTALKAKKPLFCVRYITPEPWDKIAGNVMLVGKGATYIDGKNPILPIKVAVAEQMKQGKGKKEKGNNEQLTIFD